VDTDFVNELAKKLADAVPAVAGNFGAVGTDLERHFRAMLLGAFERLDLVSREEFEVQRKVLERTREHLATLEADLEQIKTTLINDRSP
jgi:BMFP domain-containing protein YqiC